MSRPESAMTQRRRLARSAEQTEALGAALARAMPQPRHGAAVLYLKGELGAGKTTLARGFLRECGVVGTVRSPTFALLECYELADLVVAHVDLYRLGEPCDLEQLGLRDLAGPRHVWLVEWPERGEGELPQPDLCIGLRAISAGQGREITVSAHSSFGRSWLAAAVEFSPRST
jgi:tRNA threonylcarbamoyladenosine biosynthesis protein TsaE